ncbi:phosphatidylglycerophosphatase A [bacterium]|nr:MAG: phosphatidylglycerophosphatase A [bacterium]
MAQARLALKKNIIKFIGTGAYTGYFPFMPGTIGTLVGVPIAYLISAWPLYAQAAFILFVFCVSVYTAGETAIMLGKSDPPQVVCDEITGYLISIFLIPFTAVNVIIAFVFFRFFDILKPFPIRQVDRRIRGGIGITLDDVVAGVFANICAQAALWLIKNRITA